jgi:LacI family transcriptional regulator
LLVPDITNPFFTEVARGAGDTASESDYTLILCNSDEDPKKEERHLKVLIEQRICGLLITPSFEGLAGVAELNRRNIPTTFIDRRADYSDQSSVSMDDFHGGKSAIEYLASLGHKSVAWVNGPLSIAQCAHREDGVMDSAKAQNIKISKFQVSQMRSQNGYEVTQNILTSNAQITAIFCANDLVALGVLRALLESGKSIPKDYALIGYDDIGFSASASIPLTSIAQPAYKLGALAAQMIINEVEHGKNFKHEQIVFKPELVIRASTQALRK